MSLATNNGELLRRSMMSWAGKLVGLMIVIIMTWAAALAWNAFKDYPPLPKILQNIPITTDPNDQAFSKFLISRFPLGTPDTALVRELWADGFTPGGVWTATRREADYTRFGDVLHDICRTDSSVLWTVDRFGKLTSLNGVYADTC